MPSKWSIKNICSPCCVWHKPGAKEEMSCGGVVVIERLGTDRVPPATAGEEEAFENSHGRLLRELVCDDCEFAADGCDFVDPTVDAALPCGGYIHIERLLIDGHVTEAELRRTLGKRVV